MVRTFDRFTLAGLVLALGLTAALSGCAPGAIIDKLPGDLGLPAGAPERPTQPYVYPAVHDMPPPRPAPTMTEEQQVTLEKELKTARDKQEAQMRGKASEKELKSPRPPKKARPPVPRMALRPTRDKSLPG